MSTAALLGGALAVALVARDPPARGGPAPARAQQQLSAVVGEALARQHAYALTRALVDEVGARPTGSSAGDRAVAWAETEMRAMGLRNVRREPLMAAAWTRGEESLEIVRPAPHRLVASALGGSSATPAEGVEAEVIVVSSLEALAALGEHVRGKIVVFDKKMIATSSFDGYGDVVPLRADGPRAAARLGAAAVLVRSAGTGYHRLAHTGAMSPTDDRRGIPAAALAQEDADQIARLIAAGQTVTVRLRLGAQPAGKARAWNVMGELPGTDLASELVLLGAHLDSWDVGSGALDDAAGCGLVLGTARALLQAGVRPRRTIRVVLFAGEELDGAGSRAYAEAHAAELPMHFAALEADAGAGRPTGFAVAGGPAAQKLVRRWIEPLSRLAPPEIESTALVGADLIPLQKRGVPVLAVTQDLRTYFDWHHSDGDTLDKIDPLELAVTAAVTAGLTLAVANAEQRLPPPLPPPEW
jgi:hypothetical protein